LSRITAPGASPGDSPGSGEEDVFSASRWELLRALGAISAFGGQHRHALEDALGLPAVAAEDHTEVFVLECPPYASVHLGPEGKLGGEAADRVAGFSRALGLVPAREPDHLASLLDLYASLGERAGAWGSPEERAAFHRAREALLFEHLWSWLPGYLQAVGELGIAPLGQWAELLSICLEEEVARSAPPERLGLALRGAPGRSDLSSGRGAMLASMTIPILSGIVLTRSRLRHAAAALGAGMRIGERRFALGALIDQEPEATLTWLANEAGRWADAHALRALLPPAVDPAHWWSRRAAASAADLGSLSRPELR